MKKKFWSAVFMATLLFTGATFVSCDDDDDDNVPEGYGVITFENVTAMKDFVESGVFLGKGNEEINRPIILPGQSVSFKFSAGKGQALMFATMYAYSNDLFFAPENPGLALYTSDGKAVTGDVSSQIKLWDNGTRINQAPGPQVTHPGEAEDGNVTVISGMDAQGNSYLPVSDLMKAELAYDETSSEFTFTLTNISKGTANETPFSAGVWVVSNMLEGKLVNSKPFFTSGDKSSEQLTTLAETGNTDPLQEAIKEKTGIITTLSPAIVVVYTGETNPIYELNKKDPGNGLKSLAQTGSALELKAALNKMSNVKYVYIAGTQSIAPGEKFETQFRALDGTKVAYATMFGYSNDWFYANGSAIRATLTGNITDETLLIDDGTAVSQFPGAGNAQAIFGGKPIPEDKVLEPVGNIYSVPAVSNIIKVSIR